MKASNELQETSSENTLLGGSNNLYKVGGRVCLRDYKDNYPTRPWEIAHMGPKFITIKAIDQTGLNNNESTKVVLPYDIYPESDAQLTHKPQIPQVHNPLSNVQPHVVPQQPSVIIAPKFFNGDGSDNSTSELPTTQLPTQNEPSIVENVPNIVVKENPIRNNVVKDTVKEEPKDIDFSNLVIKKVN